MQTEENSPQSGAPAAAWLLVGVMVLIELLLSAADSGFVVRSNWRAMFFAHGAFWQPLLDGAPGLYAGQKYLMFISHAFLHGGLIHALMNGVILLALGKMIATRAGTGFMLVAFVICAVAGGVGFGYLTSTSAPMIGASGAAFGFMGVWQGWDLQLRRTHGLSLLPVGRTLIGLIAINVLLAVMLSGALAWQAHLGGFIAGFLIALAVPPNRSVSVPPQG